MRVESVGRSGRGSAFEELSPQFGDQSLIPLSKPTALDFFAGSGLTTEALKPFFKVVWANDIAEKKAAVFQANHAKKVLHVGPIEKISGACLPYGCLSWGSFPCQDLSLAGNLSGIRSSRSGLVWHWLRVMDEMRRKPPIVVAENVFGLIGARAGQYYRDLHTALVDRGYRVGSIVVDAVHWVPQSRKRIFVIGVDRSISTVDWESPDPTWVHPTAIRKLADGLENWVWWSLPKPRARLTSLSDILDDDVPFDEPGRSEHNLGLIPANHRERLEQAIALGQSAFTGYKRTRNPNQVLELRFDGIAGCLRTPEGGSSRQVVVIQRNGNLGTRLLTRKEIARLMGVRQSYRIPGSYNDAYKAMGDAVVVPAVKHLARYLLAPITERLSP